MSEDVSLLQDIDETVLVALETAFNNDYSIIQACQYAKIGRATYYRWIQDPIIAERMAVAQNMPLRKSREIVIKAINEGDAGMAFKFLQARDPDYKHKAAIEVDPNLQATEEKIKDFLDDTDNLPDNSGTTEAESTDQT